MLTEFRQIISCIAEGEVEDPPQEYGHESDDEHPPSREGEELPRIHNGRMVFVIMGVGLYRESTFDNDIHGEAAK